MREVAIVGAGLSGLSTAVHLVSSGPRDLHLTVFDPRTTFDRDRTWCSWLVEPHPFERCIDHRWQAWTVRDELRTVTRGARTPYVHIPADAFYAAAIGILERSGRVTMELGTTVDRIEDHGANVTVVTAAGARWPCELALDSRPLGPHALPRVGSHDVVLLQHFGGRVVQTERDVFDPRTVTLMDFDVPQDFAQGIHFLYVLPYTANRALVESTWFGPSPAGPEVYDQAIDQALERRFGLRPDQVETLEREQGVIPMTTAVFDPRPSPGVMRIGLAGGHAKASSGYAFIGVQRFASRLAAALHQGLRPPTPAVRPVRAEFLDRVFLAHLAAHPETGPALFRTLFEKVAPARLIRFLSETSTPQDDLAVVVACRSFGLARTALQSRRTWLPPAMRSIRTGWG